MMQTYVIFTKFDHDQELSTLPQRAQAVKDKIIAAAPALTGKWSHKFAFVGGRFDAMDVVTAEDPADVALAANIIERVGRCHVEVSSALSWGDYVSVQSGRAHTLPPRATTAETNAKVGRFAIFTTFPEGFDDHDLPQLSVAVRHNIMEELPSLTAKWVCDLLLLGGSSVDAVDVVEASSASDVARAASIIRTVAQCSTEVVPVMPWSALVARLAGSKAA